MNESDERERIEQLILRIEVRVAAGLDDVVCDRRDMQDLMLLLGSLMESEGLYVQEKTAHAQTRRDLDARDHQSGGSEG